ncbi:MAG TPA: hypothetical protein DF783_07510 [Acidimicrobiaceae bacterium]|nr:hypothetical protein [Acidimicrobiaceae bacterium]
MIISTSPSNDHHCGPAQAHVAWIARDLDPLGAKLLHRSDHVLTCVAQPMDGATERLKGN